MVLWVVSGGYFVEIPFKSVEATCDHHAYVIHHTCVGLGADVSVTSARA